MLSWTEGEWGIEIAGEETGAADIKWGGEDTKDEEEEDEDWLWAACNLLSARAVWILLDCRVSDMYCCSNVDKWYLENVKQKL